MRKVAQDVNLKTRVRSGKMPHIEVREMIDSVGLINIIKSAKIDLTVIQLYYMKLSKQQLLILHLKEN